MIRWRTVGALALEASVAWSATALAAWLWHPVWTPLLAVLVATRQHALFILYHDAVHCLVASPQRLNDAIIDAVVGVPQCLPVHLYRALHLRHHRAVGTARDPERLLLYVGQDWAYRPLPARKLARQLLGDLLLVNNLRTAGRFFLERRRLALPRGRVFPEVFVLAALFWGAVAAFAWSAPTLALRVAIVWFVPLLTLTQAIQKVRSFAEHGADELSYSWRPGLIGRLVLWPYNIHFHREHHERPGVPWYELPTRFPDRDARPGHTLPTLLWDGTW